MDVNSLPVEMLQKIFSYLSIEDKFRFECICRLWQQHIFSNTRSLSFENVCCDHHRLTVNKSDLLPQQTNNDDEILKLIISKCGNDLRSFKGFISYSTMECIAKQCRKLKIIDISVDNLRTLKILSDTFGCQLTCITLEITVIPGIRSFISACPNLISLSIIKPHRYSCNTPQPLLKSTDIFDFTEGTTTLPDSLKSLKTLIIKPPVEEEMLHTLSLFTRLKNASLSFVNNICHSSLWECLMTSWSSLTSLSLEMRYAPNTFDLLPFNLEYLSLRINGSPRIFNRNQCPPINLPTNLTKLKTLKIYLHSAFDASISVNNVSQSCPDLTEFSLICCSGSYGFVDDQLTSLLTLKALKKLSLGNQVNVSDIFCTTLLTELKHLTSWGSYASCDYDQREYFLPSSQLFWQALTNKAVAFPSKQFNLIGEAKEPVRVQLPLPPNVFVCVIGHLTANADQMIDKEHLWLETIKQHAQVKSFKVEVLDFHLNVSDLPTSIEKLTIMCCNGKAGERSSTFVINKCLPKLKYLSISQQFLTNQELGEILNSVAVYCPQLCSLQLDRGNTEHEPTDDYMKALLECQGLISLNISENFAVSDRFGAKLAEEVEPLNYFGTKPHQKAGIECGPLFLKALVAKALKGVTMFVLGGPTHLEVLERIKPLEKPVCLHILPR